VRVGLRAGWGGRDGRAICPLFPVGSRRFWIACWIRTDPLASGSSLRAALTAGAGIPPGLDGLQCRDGQENQRQRADRLGSTAERHARPCRSCPPGWTMVWRLRPPANCRMRGWRRRYNQGRSARGLRVCCSAIRSVLSIPVGAGLCGLHLGSLPGSAGCGRLVPGQTSKQRANSHDSSWSLVACHEYGTTFRGFLPRAWDHPVASDGTTRRAGLGVLITSGTRCLQVNRLGGSGDGIPGGCRD
jgi:hypothetical protein